MHVQDLQKLADLLDSQKPSLRGARDTMLTFLSFLLIIYLFDFDFYKAFVFTR